MYLIPIHVPIYIRHGRPHIGTEWKRALELLRDSLGGQFGHLCVLAPTRSAERDVEQVLEPATVTADDIELVPSFDERVRLKHYWAGGAHLHWKRQMRDLLSKARVVHATVGDAFRPYCYTALRMASAAQVPSIFVLDQDIVSRMDRERERLSGLKRLQSKAHAMMYAAQCRHAARLADLLFLKGRTTLERYAPFARSVLQIEDTSYQSDEIVPDADIHARVQELVSNRRPLRLGFCGRLVDIKGIDDSLALIAAARKAGASIEFDVIGSGPELPNLQKLAQGLGIASAVRFHGGMPYGRELLAKLAHCDALLFTPRIEETPRMIFDGYAAGLPLVARAIDYVVERAETDQAAVLLPRERSTPAEAAAILVGLDRDRQRLATLTTAAMAAARRHAADNWYRKRAERTLQMVEQHRAQRRLQKQEP